MRRQTFWLCGHSADLASLEPGAAATARILVVDDEATILALARWSLTRRGYEVETTAHPNEVLQMIRRAPGPDLVLADIAMPEMSGLELTARIASECPSVPVVLMSGEVPEPLSLPRVSAFIQKPFRPSHLLAMVEKTLQQARELREARRDQIQDLRREAQRRRLALLKVSIELARERLAAESGRLGRVKAGVSAKTGR